VSCCFLAHCPGSQKDYTQVAILAKFAVSLLTDFCGSAPLRVEQGDLPKRGQMVKASVLLLNCKRFLHFGRDNRRRRAIHGTSNCLALNNLYSFAAKISASLVT